jgi:hypothetical protein
MLSQLYWPNEKTFFSLFPSSHYTAMLLLGILWSPENKFLRDISPAAGNDDFI